MTKQAKRLRLLLFVLFLFIIFALPAFFVLLDSARSEGEPIGWVVTGPRQRYTEAIPVFDIRDYGYQPIVLPKPEETNEATAIEQGGASDPNNPFAVIRKTGPTFIQPGATARYEITLTNYEGVTQTYRLTDTLPPQLAYIPGSADGLVYDPATRSLIWQGKLLPGRLDYVIEENGITLPYLDLAGFGAVNLCNDFVANGEDCDDVTVTFNLGVNGYTTNLYGDVLSQLTVSSNGLVLGSDVVASGHNQWLPDAAAPDFLLAGLWRDVDLTSSGRWHAAIIRGLVADHDVFYAQWHNAPHASNPDLTVRHAIAVILNGDGMLDGHAFFIYDNISDPAQIVNQGYTIGIEDKLGARGTVYAYSPCCGNPQPPQGYPPTAGTTLHLRPMLFGANNTYRRTFSYEATVNGQVPEMITNTAVATSTSDDPSLANAWATHYLYVRWQTYLPFLPYDEVTP
jgi:uncharacterized repeat protein (TIGR01451 family)